jgi:hypothetical protein
MRMSVGMGGTRRTGSYVCIAVRIWRDEYDRGTDEKRVVDVMSEKAEMRRWAGAGGCRRWMKSTGY